jgi:hypothetical protein
VSQPDDEPRGLHRKPRRRTTRVVALLLGGLLSVSAGAAIGAVLDGGPPSGAALAPTSAPTSALTRTATPAVSPAATPALRGTPTAEQQRVAALQVLLSTRAKAVLSGDKASWLSTVDPTQRSFRTAQSTLFDNLRDVGFSSFGYTYGSVAATLPAPRRRELGASAWVARVVTDYQIRTFDRTPSRAEQYFTSVRRAGRWYLAADSDQSVTPQPWDIGRISVVRGSRVLVMGTAERAVLQSFAKQGDAAVSRVSAVWGERWSRRAVLVVPTSQRQMGRLLQRADGLDQVAAVTTGELSATGAAAAGSDRVVINPAAFARLGASGRRVVLTHELTHVAVRSSTSASVPIWLSEGFADYVGYQGVGLDRRTVAADVLALVRRGEGYRQLPTAADFDPARTTIAPAYSAAWLACLLIADRYGQQGLVQLYRTAATAKTTNPDAALATAFRQVLGMSQAQFTTRWRSYLSGLAKT